MMNSPPAQDVTQLLADWSNGDRTALDTLIPIVYDELRHIAHRYLSRERKGHTLQTTALVNEAYLKLVNEREMHWQNRAHFFAVAAGLMRNLLVDYARTKNYAKRGGGWAKVSLSEAMTLLTENAAEILALDDALKALTQFDERKSRIAELRYFGGLSVEETAEVLQVSAVTVMREWRLAKAWLHRELTVE